MLQLECSRYKVRVRVRRWDHRRDVEGRANCMYSVESPLYILYTRTGQVLVAKGHVHWYFGFMINLQVC